MPNHLDVDRLISERFAQEANRLDEVSRKSLLALQLARLDALLAAVWPAAMMGDPKSVHEAGDLVMKEARISGLESIDPVVQKNLVLVMGEKEEDYIKALKNAGQ